MDTPTKNPKSGRTGTYPPGKLKVINKVKPTAPDPGLRPMPAEPKRSIQKSSEKAETKFNSRGAARPWKPKGGRAAMRTLRCKDVKSTPVTNRRVVPDDGISHATGMKVKSHGSLPSSFRTV